MHNVKVLGTIDTAFKRVVDTDYNTSTFRWLTLVGLETGVAHRIEGRGHTIETMLDLIEDGVHRAELNFVSENGGAVLIVELRSSAANSTTIRRAAGNY